MYRYNDFCTCISYFSVQVHQDPIRYHHLYKYLANRSATVAELSKVH